MGGEHTLFSMDLTTQSGSSDSGDPAAVGGDGDHGTDPRPAATVVLLREGAGGTELLLTIRPRRLSFMGGAAVFPGGALDPGDFDSDWEHASVLSRADAAQALATSDANRALAEFVCAMREAFEEVGWIAGDGPLNRIARGDAEDAVRFRRACLDAGVVLATDRLVPAGRWVTPLGSPRRFDTRFFIMRTAPGWEPDPAPDEVEDCFWTTASDALEGLAAGRLLMAPPTIEMLQRLAGHADADSILESLSTHGVGRQGLISTRLSAMVHVIVAPNPGLLTGPGTNTYVVGAGPTFVIDPAVDDSEFVRTVTQVGGDIDSILVTHRHPDHVGGIATIARATGARVRAFDPEPAGGVDVDALSDGEVLRVGGTQLRAIHTPGHARDHVCFYSEPTASLFSGDNILGEGTAVIAPPEGDMRAYLRSLKLLSELHIERIFPGHFRALDGGNTFIARYMEHRRTRHSALLAALRDGPADIPALVELIYTDVAPELHSIATYSVRAHLEMAEQDGIVGRRGAVWHLLKKSAEVSDWPP
jgi:glyoxylase-like metal-dependent hydrolase (beta-lactamase superfamily II)/8-oxo-dGTP pyrophosphatase MutT (NUDIX family)